MLYSPERVKEICESYVITQTETNSDPSAIQFVEHHDDEIYASVYDEQVLKKDPDNDMYKIIIVEEESYTGYITVLYHPERLDLAVTNGKTGDYPSTFARKYDAMVCTNCGPAKWYNNFSTLRPYNTIIADGEIIYSNGKAGEIIGMNNDNVLCLWNTTAEDAKERGLRWGVMFGPYLIVNGVETKFTGNGGYGINPRTAIGQRRDGIVLLFTIDGRGGGGSSGISMTKLADLCMRYGCYNAANLDGGGSTTLIVNKKLVNNPVSWNHTGERKLYNCLVYH